MLTSCAERKIACDTQRIDCMQQLQPSLIKKQERVPVSQQPARPTQTEKNSICNNQDAHQLTIKHHRELSHASNKSSGKDPVLSLNIHTQNGPKTYVARRSFHAAQVHRIGFQKIAIIGAILLLLFVATVVVLPLFILLTMGMLVFALFYHKTTQEEHRETLHEIMDMGKRLIKKSLWPLGITAIITVILILLLLIAALSSFAGGGSPLIGLAIFLYVLGAISSGVMLYFLALFFGGLLLLIFAGAFWLVYIESGV
jgi:hypothetical protein